MKEELFNELLESVHEGGKILRGKIRVIENNICKYCLNTGVVKKGYLIGTICNCKNKTN